MTVPLAMDLTLQEATQVLGSFDPATLLINLSAATGSTPTPITPRSRGDTLNRAPLPVTTHELAHFFQTTSTAVGLRLFALWTDALSGKFRLIAEAVCVREGLLVAPIYRTLSEGKLSDPQLASAWHDYVRLISRRLSHYGGWNLPPTALLSARAIPPGPFYVIDEYSLFGQRLPRPLLLADMTVVDGTQRAIVIGARHLREGAAKAVELIQARLTRSTGRRAVFGPEGEHLIPFSNETRLLADPYYLCNSMYAALIRILPDCKENSSLEEFIAIADLAMMLDSLITHWKGIRNLEGEERRKALLELDRIDVTPAEVYLHLLSTFANSRGELNRLKPGYSQADVARFQTELLQQAGGEGSLVELVCDCESFVEDAFALWLESSPIPNNVLTMFHDIFNKLLRWRREVLQGGAVLIDLLTSDEKLQNLFLGIVPAFVVNSFVYSSMPGCHSEAGVGVDMGTVQQMHDLSDALIQGDRACPLHLTRPRSCCVDPFALCKSISCVSWEQPRCIREQTLHMLLDAVGVQSFKWDEQP